MLNFSGQKVVTFISTAIQMIQHFTLNYLTTDANNSRNCENVFVLPTPSH